jgi:hypothetical protein
VVAEELRVERERGGEAAAVAAERTGGKEKASGKPGDEWEHRKGRAECGG